MRFVDSDTIDVKWVKYVEPTEEELARYHGSVAEYRFGMVESLIGPQEAKVVFKRLRESLGRRKDFRALYRTWKTNPEEALKSEQLFLHCETCTEHSDVVFLPCGHSETCKSCTEEWVAHAGRGADVQDRCCLCRERYDFCCDIKWFSEEPRSFFQRMYRARKTAQLRKCEKRRLVRATKKVAELAGAVRKAV